MTEERIKQKETGALTFLYGSPTGRAFLKLLTLPAISVLCGCFMNSPPSKLFIGSYIRRHRIDMNRYEETPYRSFNDFFTRKLSVPVFADTHSPHTLHAPCDGKLSVYSITEERSFHIKKSIYSLPDLLGSPVLAEEYTGGTCLIFRLTPDDYHRYCFFDDGNIVSQKTIQGVLHTVRPIAHSHYPVFVQNTRMCTVMQTHHFGTVIQVEVGAMMVGKIKNHKSHGSFAYGEEKGFFEFGGSTIILLFKNGALMEQTMPLGEEYAVRAGEIIGGNEKGWEAKCEL